MNCHEYKSFTFNTILDCSWNSVGSVMFIHVGNKVPSSKP